MDKTEFIDRVVQNPLNRELLTGLSELDIPQCMLTAGALFQTVWNLQSGFAPERGIKDYDIIYYDDTDLSWEAEDRVIKRISKKLGALGELIEVKNQARVHLWYKEKFGADYPALKRVEEGIDRYLINCTKFGIHTATGQLYCPDGFDDLVAGSLKMNPINPQPQLFYRKAADYISRWPWLRCHDPTDR